MKHLAYKLGAAALFAGLWVAGASAAGDNQMNWNHMQGQGDQHSYMTTQYQPDSAQGYQPEQQYNNQQPQYVKPSTSVIYQQTPAATQVVYSQTGGGQGSQPQNYQPNDAYYQPQQTSHYDQPTNDNYQGLSGTYQQPTSYQPVNNYQPQTDSQNYTIQPERSYQPPVTYQHSQPSAGCNQCGNNYQPQSYQKPVVSQPPVVYLTSYNYAPLTYSNHSDNYCASCEQTPVYIHPNCDQSYNYDSRPISRTSCYTQPRDHCCQSVDTCNNHRNSCHSQCMHYDQSSSGQACCR